MSASHQPSISAGEVTQICNDVNTWLKTAANQGAPRFDARLSADESKANGTTLGSDLANMDNDLQQINSLALTNGPPGQAMAIQAVAADCAPYGVTLSPGDGSTITLTAQGREHQHEDTNT
jgi:hypothetical protein